MEIEVDEYVRTKDGIIDIVILAYKGKCNNPNCNDKHISCKINYYREDNISKHSKNIIDLIEVGDIVQVKDIQFLDEDKKYIFDIEMLEALKTNIKNNNFEILSILTHEQFEQNAYRLEENND